MKELEKVETKSAKRGDPRGHDDRRPPLDVGAVLKASAVALGFNPKDTRYLNRYIADTLNEHVKHCTCIRCGRVGLKRRSVSVTDPVQMLRDLSELNGKIRPVFGILKKLGRIDRPTDKDVVLYNGFCSACVGSMDENMPNAFRFDPPGENDFEILKCLVAECVRLGATQEAIFDLERIVKDHTVPNWEEEEEE
jgi:hypothetical protein